MISISTSTFVNSDILLFLCGLHLLDKIMKEWMAAIEQTLEKYKKAGVGMSSISYQQDKDEPMEAPSPKKEPAIPKEKPDISEAKLTRRHSSLSGSSSKRASHRIPSAGIRTSIMGPPKTALAKSSAFSEESVSEDENVEFEEESEQIDDEFKSKVRSPNSLLSFDDKPFVDFISLKMFRNFLKP
jgi:hypothetical protein